MMIQQREFYDLKKIITAAMTLQLPTPRHHNEKLPPLRGGHLWFLWEANAIETYH